MTHRFYSRIIHDNGFTDDEILSKRNMVYANVLQSVRAVLEGMFKLDLPLGSEKARVSFKDRLHEFWDPIIQKSKIHQCVFDFLLNF